jgi:HEAT repeat protein
MARNHLLGMLAGGDLRSDGMANEVVEIVLANEELFDDLYEGLRDSDDVVRGHTADALEKIARSRPELLANKLSELLQFAVSDSAAMVRWHIAMILGYLAIYPDKVSEIGPVLLELLDDQSVFVKSWSITSLSIIGRNYPEWKDEILVAIAGMQGDRSAAVRSRVRNALALLSDDNLPYPPGWIKSEQPF